MASFNLSDIQRANAIRAIAGLRVAHPSISKMPMALALPSFKPISDEAKQTHQAIGLLLAALESGDETTITAATSAFTTYAAPLLEAELIGTGWYPKMTTDSEKAWLAEAIPAFTHAAVETAKQHVAAARAGHATWAKS